MWEKQVMTTWRISCNKEKAGEHEDSNIFQLTGNRSAKTVASTYFLRFRLLPHLPFKLFITPKNWSSLSIPTVILFNSDSNLSSPSLANNLRLIYFAFTLINSTFEAGGNDIGTRAPYKSLQLA